MKNVRRASCKDIPRILDLLVQVCMVHHNGRPDLFNGPATKYTKEELEVMINNDLDPIFVCVNEAEEVMGYAFCIHQQNTESHVLTDIKTLYVDDICVDERFRGQHVGQTLYEYVVDYARQAGYYNLTLNVWTCNPSAMKFYEKMGLKPYRVGMETIL